MTPAVAFKTCNWLGLENPNRPDAQKGSGFRGENLTTMDNQEIFETLFTPAEQEIKFGQVVCFEPNYEKQTLKEIGRTAILPFFDALNAYSEIPNPASQLLRWTTEEERTAAEAELQKNIQDTAWLEELFECI